MEENEEEADVSLAEDVESVDQVQELVDEADQFLGVTADDAEADVEPDAELDATDPEEEAQYVPAEPPAPAAPSPKTAAPRSVSKKSAAVQHGRATGT